MCPYVNFQTPPALSIVTRYVFDDQVRILRLLDPYFIRLQNSVCHKITTPDHQKFTCLVLLLRVLSDWRPVAY